MKENESRLFDVLLDQKEVDYIRRHSDADANDICDSAAVETYLWNLLWDDMNRNGERER